MSKYKELIYIVSDLAKTLSDDSVINENHIIFLLHKHRSSILMQYYLSDPRRTISMSNYQTICVDLEKIDLSPECIDKCMFADGPDRYLRSESNIPNIMNFGNVRLVGDNVVKSSFAYVPFERLETVGYNSWLKNIIYGSTGYDHRLYLKSANEKFLEIDKVMLSAVFEDPEEAYAMSKCKDGCGCGCGCDTDCDIYERDFPMEEGLQLQLIKSVLNEVVGAAYRPKDSANNATDDLANLASYINQALKERFANSSLGRQVARDE